MCKDKKLMRMLEVYEEQYETEMLDEYYYYEDSIIDKLAINLNCIKVG